MPVPCFNVIYQAFHILKLIVVAVYALTMINDPFLLIPFKAVQKIFFTISSGKLCKAIRLDFP